MTYAPPGYLLFVRDKTLVAQPFDAKALKTTGEPMPLAEQIGTDTVGLARFSVSRNGVLAYRTGESGGPAALEGPRRTRARIPGGPRRLRGTRPCLRRGTGWPSTWPIRGAARPTSGSGTSRGASTRASAFGAGNNFRPQWSPDGEPRSSSRPTAKGPPISTRRQRGARARRSCVSRAASRSSLPAGARDGRYIAATRARTRSRTGTSGLCRPSAIASRFPSSSAPFVEIQPVFSPDGRFVAYRVG